MGLYYPFSGDVESLSATTEDFRCELDAPFRQADLLALVEGQDCPGRGMPKIPLTLIKGRE